MTEPYFNQPVSPQDDETLAPAPEAKELVVPAVPAEDLPKVAAKRGIQTLWVSLLAVVIVYAIAPLVSAVNGAEGWAGLASTWTVWTWDIFKGALVAGVTAVGAWLQRRYLDKAGVEQQIH